MNILIGIDGSTHSFESLRQAASLSGQDDTLILYYSPPQLSVSKRGTDATVAQRARQALADAVFAEAIDRLAPDRRTTVRTVVGDQSPKVGLLETADRQQADLIVVGARGSSGLARLLIGGVATAVAHAAHVPVLIARSSRHGDESLQAMLAHDGSPSACAASDFLSQLHWPRDAVGHLIGVVEWSMVGEVPDWLMETARDAEGDALAQQWVQEHEQDKQRMRQQLAACQADLPEIFHKTAPIVAEGGAAQSILEAIEQQHIDLVIMGARGLRAFERMMIGSTSDKVMRHAPCSMLIVRQPA